MAQDEEDATEGDIKMKYYKDYPLISFGMSDIASLVLVYFDNVDYEVQSKILPMGSDGA